MRGGRWPQPDPPEPPPFPWLRHLAVTGTVALADALWTAYIGAVADRAAALAGWYSAGILICGAFITLAYVRDRRYLVSAAAGGFLGTYLMVRFG